MPDLDGDIAHETDKAWFFVPEGEHEHDGVWCPKSICQWHPIDDQRTDGSMYMPEWFALKNDLI